MPICRQSSHPPRWCAAIFSVAILLAVGCDTSDDPPDTAVVGPAFAGKSVTVAVPQTLSVPLGELWDLPLREWSSVSGANHRVFEYDPSDLASAKSADVLVLPWTVVAATNELAPVPESLRVQGSLDWADLFPGLRDGLANVAGQPTAVPISCPVLVCYYRSDLLEKAGLQPPATWTDYQALIESLEDWAPGLTAVEPWGDQWRATMFLARAAASAKPPDQLSFCFDIRTAEPLVDTPGFVAALKQARQALQEMPPAVQTYTPDDCRRELLAGRAALGIAMESHEEMPRTDGIRLGIVRLPGTVATYNQSTQRFDQLQPDRPHFVSLTGFAGLSVVVSADAGSPDAAWDLVVHLTTPDAAANFPPPLSSPVRQSQTLDAARWAGSSLTGEERAAWVGAVAASLSDAQQIPELPLVGRERFRQVLSQTLTSTADEQTVLQQVAAEWRAILKELGPDRVRRSYRRSLGIPSP